jgi:2-oxoglutarate ferredoxin oxidoreductase subunit delta
VQKGTITVSGELCKECGLCIEFCAKNCIAAGTDYNARGYRPVLLADGERCTGCAVCAIMCPEVAIEVYRE